MSYEIIAIPAFKDNYIWTLINREQRAAICFDPGEASRIVKFLQDEQLSLAAICVTHHHWDHTNGIIKLLSQFPCAVYGPAAETIPCLTHPLKASDKVKFEQIDLELEILEIPGHTLGHIAFYGDGKLFCGDTLFGAGCGRVFEGTNEQMYKSLQSMAKLPAETEIYCGHEYTINNLLFAQSVEPGNLDTQERLAHCHALRGNGQPTLPSTIADELATNPFLRCDEITIRQNIAVKTGQQLQDPIEVFGLIRQWKNRF